MAVLEGIPLAIELAAARSRVLGPERVLARGPLSALRTAIDASREMLNEIERDPLAILYLEPTCKKKLPACTDDADFCQD